MPPVWPPQTAPSTAPERVDPTSLPSELWMLRDLDGYWVEATDGDHAYLAFLTETDAREGAFLQAMAHDVECTPERVL